ncbi:hypothetical protein GQ457_03G021870 [Hibiscus cannabinus]
MKRVAHAIQGAVGQGVWKAFKFACGGPFISHLFFADDLVLFFEASLDQLDVIQGILGDFYNCSGQSVSIWKTSIFFSHNVPIELHEDIDSFFDY